MKKKDWKGGLFWQEVRKFYSSGLIVIFMRKKKEELGCGLKKVTKRKEMKNDVG